LLSYNEFTPPAVSSKQVRPKSAREVWCVSLYRTWRPKTFGELVGQDAVVRTLQTALSSGKLAHAYLFSGPRGSGKTSAAKIFARCIECVAGPAPEPDNTCENCRAILAGNALDVLEIDAASNRGIDEIRALRESAKFAPASMRYKVFIIDEAHMLTREGSNAFLKTLEEPPPHAVFILATTAPDKLLPTILSRCQRYAFRRIGVPTMIARMHVVADAEGIAIDDGALGAIAYRADGGLRDALTMLEQVTAFAGGAVDRASVDAAFGSTGREFARRLTAAILAADARAALRVVDEASDGGADMLGLIRGTIAEYRNLLVARIDPDLLSRDLAQSDADEIVGLAVGAAQVSIVRALRLLADALAAGHLSGNPRLELETALLRLIVQSEDTSLEALATRVALLESDAPAVRPAAAPAARPSMKPVPQMPSAAPEPAAKAASPAPAAPTLNQIRSMWEQVRTRVEEREKPLRAALSRATVDALEGDVLTIGTVDVFQDRLRAKIGLVEAALAEVVGTPLRVVLRSGGAVPARAGSSAHRAPPGPASGGGAGVETEDLMAYARQRLGGSETT
jgi:DNA polymerase-3 subunit gamma/tau